MSNISLNLRYMGKQPKMLTAVLASIFLLCCHSSILGQVDSIKAVQFAKKPNPDALDTIQFYADYFKGKDDLLNWINIYSNAGMELFYYRKEVERGIHMLEIPLDTFRSPRDSIEWDSWAKLHHRLGYAF
ncbi:MAG: hypothetical protein ACKVT2_04940, partial [Saprospiraceae bacterium]